MSSAIKNNKKKSESSDKDLMQELLRNKSLSVARMPTMAYVSELFVKFCSEKMLSIMNEEIQVSIKELKEVVLDDFVKQENVLIYKFGSSDFQNDGLIVLNQEVVNFVVNSFLGANSSSIVPIKGDLKKVDESMIGCFVKIICDSFALSMQNLIDGAAIHYSKINGPIGPFNEDAFLCDVIVMGDARFQLCLPHSLLQDFLQELGKQPLLVSRGSWTPHFDGKINEAKVELSIALQDKSVEFETLSKYLELGNTIMFSHNKQVNLLVNGVTVGVGEVGQVGEMLAVQLFDRVVDVSAMKDISTKTKSIESETNVEGGENV